MLETMKWTWKALEPTFGHRDGDSVTTDDCRSYTARRRKAGKSDGSIHTELGHLRTVLKWAEKRRLIPRAPDIDRPKKPAPKERYLTKDEARAILAAATLPHVRLAIHLMLATAARIGAILELPWSRVDLKRRLIYLTDPGDKTARKGRATVPINDTLFAALLLVKSRRRKQLRMLALARRSERQRLWEFSHGRIWPDDLLSPPSSVSYLLGGMAAGRIADPPQVRQSDMREPAPPRMRDCRRQHARYGRARPSFQARPVRGEERRRTT